ncbi:MAG TPA: LPS export ABC transporter periplasmic protein LptC [Nevskiaceae bacterium]|nr:LPS export ABC transporter periplasmic protein LptC [Nevskiaceae bacterium]
MRRLLFALPILLAVALLVLTWRGNETAVEPSSPAAEAQPRYQLDDARWIRYDERGQPEFQASAESIEYFDDESAKLSTIEMHSLGGASSPWRISAPRGHAPPHSQQRVQLYGGVDANGQWPQGEPLSFQTPSLWVDEKTHQIYTDAPVQLRGPGRSASAAGMRADWIGKSVELLGQVRTQYVLPR